MTRGRVGVKKNGHRRQYLRQDRIGFYEIMKWRSHASKFAAWQRAQLRDLIDFVICTPAAWEIHQTRREQLRQMLIGSAFTFRVKVWSTIFASRFVLFVRRSVSDAIGKVRRMFRRNVTATA
jgi:hypothetical protein